MPSIGKDQERKGVLNNKKLWVTVGAVICLAIMVAVGIYFAVTGSSKTNSSGDGTGSSDTPNSVSKNFRFSAVTTDTNICSSIGTQIMVKSGGSAVDGAIATFLCVCLVNPHSCGVGGGHFATIYEAPRNSTVKEIVTVTARERAPQAATEDMFVNKTGASTFGGLSIGVPGEIKGFHEAWKRFGRVPWRDLFLPSIRICEEGHKVERDLAKAIVLNEQIIRDAVHLRELYIHQDGSILKEGDLLINAKLGNTLRRISEDPETYYKGSLADDIIADLSESGSIITKADLESYSDNAANWTFQSPVNVWLRNGNLSLYSGPPPASGVVLEYILSILDGYNMSPGDIENDSKEILTYHRISEAFKFAYAKRSQLGDARYVDVRELVTNMTSRDYADSIRQKIDDVRTHDLMYYEPLFDYKPDSGTAHMNVLAADGASVTLTGTINTRFGSKVRGSRTGIMFNNEMDDFSTPGLINAFGVYSSPSNYIAPGKMPLSSIAPLIVMENGRPIFLAGAAGGTRITTSISFITLNNLWLGVDLKKAVDQGRIHHQLLPNYVETEKWLNKVVVQGLKDKGHAIMELASYNSVTGGIRVYCPVNGGSVDSSQEACIQAVSDGRKGGTPDGI